MHAPPARFLRGAKGWDDPIPDKAPTGAGHVNEHGHRIITVKGRARAEHRHNAEPSAPPTRLAGLDFARGGGSPAAACVLDFITWQAVTTRRRPRP